MDHLGGTEWVCPSKRKRTHDADLTHEFTADVHARSRKAKRARAVSARARRSSKLAGFGSVSDSLAAGHA